MKPFIVTLPNLLQLNLKQIIHNMQKTVKNKPGFVRVLITERNKTIQIRESHARNPKYLLKHGMVLIPEPVAPPPPMPVAPPLPPEITPQPTATKPKSQPNGK